MKQKRNEKCACGSGKKYKKCHYLMEPVKNNGQEHDISQVIQLMEAKEHQRKQQQGLGRPIIAADFQGHKLIAVGSQLHYSKDYKTFHDFLGPYIRGLFGEEWWKGELEKALEDRHPILQWHEIWMQGRAKYSQRVGEIYSAHLNGAGQSFYRLAYNLYLIQHNVAVQQELIRRLKLADRSNFHGALYEAFVVALFIRAGFEIEFENELDGTTTHCEFTATHQKTKRKFSVEAKIFQFAETGYPRVISKLNDALKKEANHERIVFIDIGRPAPTFDDSKKWLLNAVERLNDLETSPKLGGESLPPAYVIFTNHPFWYDLGGNSQFATVSEGFKIPGFKVNYSGTVKEALAEREKHKEVFELLDSMKAHQEIPATFDGSNPETTFNPDEENPPIIIGNKYKVPWGDTEEIATLIHADVMESKKLVMGMYEIEGKGTKIITCPISDSELAAYKRHPDTYFGKVEPKGGLKGALDFYDWAYEIHKDTPKENLLKFMKDWPNYEELESLSQPELAKLYCESVTEWAASKDKKV